MVHRRSRRGNRCHTDPRRSFSIDVENNKRWGGQVSDVLRLVGFCYQQNVYSRECEQVQVGAGQPHKSAAGVAINLH